MRARVSVIIPTLNAEEALKSSLPALMEGVERGVIREVIVSDGGSDDGTCGIAHGVGAELVHGAASRGGQLRRAADVAKGEWLLVLHADSVLAAGWSEAVTAHMTTPEAGPAYFKLRFDEQSLPAWITAGWANLRSRLFGLPYGDQGLLISRRDYGAAGGYPDIPLMEDVALVRALPTLRRLDGTITTSAARYRRGGWLRRGARNLWTLARYFMGVSPARLAEQYQRG